MFYVNTTDKNTIKRILDSQRRTLGFVINGRFTQTSPANEYHYDPIYKSGFSPIELEQIAEAIQRNETPPRR